MKLLALSIQGFRGIERADIKFGDHDVLIGGNGVGKSTIIDALSLVFGQVRLVRELTEHDFFGSCPEAASRIRIVATIAGFEGNDPDEHEGWFRDGRAIPKWWNAQSSSPEPQAVEPDAILCAQVGFAARFDLEGLFVEPMRYFHDDDMVEDPFVDDLVQPIPQRLLDDIGFYVLPTRRTWEAMASFASELFRKVVATVGGIPARTVLDERDRLRHPNQPLEDSAELSPLVERLNKQLARLLPAAPRFQLRVTATDSESLLRALVPHYAMDEGTALPVGRHGMGLLSLQTFLLLLELGRERRAQGKPFFFAMEEPELHIPPGLQRRLVAQAISIAEQTICTSHSPRVASYYPATSVQILERRSTHLASTTLLPGPLEPSSSNALRKLSHDDRPRVIEALMQHCVLVPEGRSEFEWFRLLSDATETGDQALDTDELEIPPFGTVVGVIPTHDSAVREVFTTLRRLRSDIVPLVDGDSAGNEKIGELRNANDRPRVILQWREGWAIEDAIGWILSGSAQDPVGILKERIDGDFDSIDALMALFKIKGGPRRLKTDYLAYEEVASVIRDNPDCRLRALDLLQAFTREGLGLEGSELVRPEGAEPESNSLLIRVTP